MEFFNNIWTWLVSNKDAIVAVLTSANFMSFITSIVLLVKTLRATKNNTLSSKALNTSVDNLTSITDTINNIDAKLNSLTIEINTIKNDLTNLSLENNEKLDTIIDKQNATMEAQLNVWSTIKDDTIRTNVNNILTTAKYKETTNVIDMRNKIEELQAKLVEKTSEIKQEVDNTVKQVKKVVKSVKDDDTAMRV